MNIEDLVGQWFIHLTNFPMWLKGDKTNPTFNYTLIKRNGINCLSDEVRYQKNGKVKTISGFDYTIDNQPGFFIWRGKGLLALLKSKWSVVHYNKTNEWMLIHFEKTIFTPSGFDIISRHSKLSPDNWIEIKLFLKEKGIQNLEEIMHD